MRRLGFTLLAAALMAPALARADARLVRDIDPRSLPRGSSPGPFVTLGGFVYFPATDEIAGRELWRTDGTPQGTSRLADVCPGACSSNPSMLARLGDRIVWSAD